MIRRPPRSTPFPTRRSSDLGRYDDDQKAPLRQPHEFDVLEHRGAARHQHHRSEEHTSELQSPCNLVCRLLLEKKKNTSFATRRTQLYLALAAMSSSIGSYAT